MAGPTLGPTLYEAILRNRAMEGQKIQQADAIKKQQDQQYWQSIMMMQEKIFAEKEKAFDRKLQIAQLEQKAAAAAGKQKEQYEDPEVNRISSSAYDLVAAEKQSAIDAELRKRQAELEKEQRKIKQEKEVNLREYYEANPDLIKDTHTIAIAPHAAPRGPEVRKKKKQEAERLRLQIANMRKDLADADTAKDKKVVDKTVDNIIKRLDKRVSLSTPSMAKVATFGKSEMVKSTKEADNLSKLTLRIEAARRAYNGAVTDAEKAAAKLALDDLLTKALTASSTVPDVPQKSGVQGGTAAPQTDPMGDVDINSLMDNVISGE